MRLIPFFIDDQGTIIGRVEELPIANSVQEAKNHIINLPRHLSQRHIEYIEQIFGEVSEVVKSDGTDEPRKDIRPCEGLED